MDILTAINERVSCPRLQEPPPDAAQLARLLKAAVRAPDHGLLRPWRFIAIAGEDRERFGQMIVDACISEQPELTEAQCEKLRAAPLRAPMVLVVVAEVQPEHKVSGMDQIMACAAAVQNLLLTAHAIGVGAMWRTGAPALSNALKVALGFAPKDEIVGFVYLGTPCGSPRIPQEDDPASYLRQLPHG